VPYKNNKGPLGEGPLTGRGFGPCEGDRSNLNLAGLGLGRGYGRVNFRRGRRGKRGRGFGYRCFGGRSSPRAWFNTGSWTTDGSDQKTFLKNYRQALEKELETVKTEEENLK